MSSVPVKGLGWIRDLPARSRACKASEEGEIMPECCGREMTEVESAFMNDCGEYDTVGYKCEVCGRRTNTEGVSNEN